MLCIWIEQINSDGAVARDGRLEVGQRILEASTTTYVIVKKMPISVHVG